MCGIVGYAGFSKKIPLDKAIKEIHHRGPDDNGVAYFEGVAVGNTRLAIIDLSPNGHQPMFNDDKSLCIVFNGEIYNYKQIQNLLKGKYHFQSDSDTEVILYAYQEWGVKCLEKLSGMFSFVIYDLKEKLLFGARDRVGQKPLKYYFDNGKFIFASEIKAILSLLDSKVEIDDAAIDNFLTLQYIPSPATGFKKIYKLPPAHYFIFKNDKLFIERYWSLNFNKKLNLTTEGWQNLIFEEIKRAVKSHLISDVPIGALLSGGLDSSIIVALMSKLVSGKINTFSLGFDDDKFDETKYAKVVSSLYNTNHTEFRITARELIENMEHIADIYDEPIADNSILPTMLVSKLASGKVKVALTGDGGDENFAGYDRYAFINLSSYISRFPKIIKDIFRLGSKTTFNFYPNKQTERLDRFFFSLNNKFYSKYINYNCFFTNITKHSLYSADFKQAVSKNDTYEIYKSLYDKELSNLDNALKIDVNTYLPDNLLYKSDNASMAYGLELRSPFLDHTLMEKVAAMPSKIKINFLTKKKILKDIALKNKLLPKDIIYRQKHGFTIPQNKWFKGPLKEYLYEQVFSSPMINKIFEKKKMQAYLDNYYKTNLNYDNNIFALLMLSSWMKKYFL